MSGMLWKRLRALLATARVANVPSVVSNVWLGAVVGSLAIAVGQDLEPMGNVGGSFWWLAAAGTCLYVAGNFLNDWYDREWDEKHRPERALPSGLFCSSTYFAVAVGLVVMAGVCAWAVNEVALGVAGLILVFVVAYTILHKRTAWGVVWVGLCRALLVVLGVTGIVQPELGSEWIHEPMRIAVVASVPLFCYIVGLSVSARFESLHEVPRWASGVSLSLLALPLLLAGGYGMFHMRWIYVIAGMVPYVSWMAICHARRKNISRYVPGLLAGIPLVDGMILLPLAVYTTHQGMALHHCIWIVPLMAFSAGLLLQRVAPAS